MFCYFKASQSIVMHSFIHNHLTDMDIIWLKERCWEGVWDIELYIVGVRNPKHYILCLPIRQIPYLPQKIAFVNPYI